MKILTAIIEKIRNLQTPIFYPWVWAVILLGLFLASATFGIGIYIWCIVTLGLM